MTDFQSAVDRLIVALDVPAADAGLITGRLMRELDLRRFKVGAASLMNWDDWRLVEQLVLDGAELMLDLKVYDVPSTVQRVVAAAHRMEARWLTVHVDCVYAATHQDGQLTAKNRPTILAVGPLTSDGPGAGYSSVGVGADGLVCHPSSAHFYRKTHGSGKLIICPGIRPGAAVRESDDHVWPQTPSLAIKNGADLLVVGRPITTAADPVAAARAIVEEIRGAA